MLSSWKISILVFSCATLQTYRIHFFKPCVMLCLWIFPRVPRHALVSSVVGHTFTSTFGVRLLFAALSCPVVLCVPAVYCWKWNLLDCSLWRRSQAFYHCYGASFMFQGVLFLGLRGFPFSLRLFHKHILSTCTPTSLPLLRATPFPHKTQKPHPYFQRLRCICGDGFIVLSLLPFLGVIPLIHFPMKNQNYIPGGMSTCWFYSICWKFLCISIWSVIFLFYHLRLFFFMVL